MRSPWRFWLAAWCTLLVLGLYGAPEVQSLVLDTPWLCERAGVVAASEQWLTLSHETGLAGLHRRVEALRGDHVRPEPVRITRASAPLPVPPAAAASTPAKVEPTPARRILLLGASSMQFALGVELERLLAQRPGVTVERHGKASTGLARSDGLDWPVRAAAYVTAFRPDLVITNFGGNDAQGMTRPGKTPRSHVVLPFASEGWDAAYGEQVGRVVDAATRAGSRVVMLGMPVMRQASFSSRIAHVNAVTRDAVEAREGLYLSTWEMASDAQGRYQKSITWSGKTGPMRAPDGHHYTPLGGSYVAARIAAELELRGLLPPAHSATTP